MRKGEQREKKNDTVNSGYFNLPGGPRILKACEPSPLSCSTLNSKVPEVSQKGLSEGSEIWHEILSHGDNF